MIKVTSIGSVEDRLNKLEQSVNYSTVILAFPCADAMQSVPAPSAASFGACSVDRAWLRQHLPDARWVVRAAGFANSADANPFTVTIEYQKDNLVTVDLGAVNTSAGAFVKLALGPFDVFATAGVPTGEGIACIRLRATKSVGATASLTGWTIWLELRAPHV